MHHPVGRLALALLACLVASGAAGAQTAAEPRVGLRGYGVVEWTSLSASDTFNATIGSSTFGAQGVGLEALRLWRGVFARVSWVRLQEAGQRVIVVDREVYPLGIPMQVTLSPLEFGAGWREPVGPDGRVAVYGGGGLLRVGYRQTSEFAGPDENVDETFSGATLFAGVDVRVVRWLIVGGEVQFRSVPDALGLGGVSEDFGDTDLGGRAVRLVVGVGF